MCYHGSSGFRDLQNYTTLKQERKQIWVYLSFRDLQNYTTLKLMQTYRHHINCFRDLQNYTTLKPQIKFEAQ